MPRRTPEAEARQALRRLLSKRPDLAALIKPLLAHVPPRASGRKPEPDNLPMLELFVRTAMRERGITRMTALRWLAESTKALHPMTASKHVANRQRRNLKKAELPKRSNKTLLQDAGLPPWFKPTLKPKSD
jgi:hypothetical protein